MYLSSRINKIRCSCFESIDVNETVFVSAISLWFFFFFPSEPFNSSLLVREVGSFTTAICLGLFLAVL